MHADRSDCPSPAEDLQQFVMTVLFSEDHPRWTHAELGRELSRPGDEPVNVDDAVGALYRAGLVHVSGDLIEPTRAARYLDDLLGNPI
jgi:hypothetical protein